MLLNLTDLSDEPLQSQIARQLRAKILAGEMPAGEILPSIRALARQTRVSVITVQRGYESLEREGLIHSRRGKGFFVSDIEQNQKKRMAEERLTSQLEPLVADAFSEGMTTEEVRSVFGRIVMERGKHNGK
jgi:GntR family transcriptional regulator